MTLTPSGTIWSVEKRNPGALTRLEIGDAREASFMPHLKSMHWDDECSLDIRLVDARYDLGITVERTGQRIEWTRGNRIARYFEVAGFEDGGLETEVVLLTKPATPDVIFTVNSKAFDFFHQPALTAQEIADGAVRPDDIVNSYAVYHSTRAGNVAGGKAYRAGKAAHIPRSWAQDALGQRVWCSQVIGSGLWTISMPTDFWNSATYPVTIGPTFGYTTAGGTSNGSQIFSSKFTAPESGSVTKLTIYASSSSSSGVHAAIYADSSGTPTTKLATSGSATTVTSAAWYDVTLSYDVSNLVYWLAGYQSNGALSFYWDSGSANQLSYRNGNAYPTWDDPFVVDGQLAWKMSIYATYTAAGGAATYPGYIGGGFF